MKMNYREQNIANRLFARVYLDVGERISELYASLFHSPNYD